MDSKIKLIASNEKVGLILIPKNGTSAMRNTYSLKFTDSNNIFNEADELKKNNNNNKTIFTVIRNPFERFITGYIEVFLRFNSRGEGNNLEHISKYLDVKNERKRIKEFMLDCANVGVEAHVEHQINFINELVPDNIMIFDYKLEEDLKNFMELNEVEYNPLSCGLNNSDEEKIKIFKCFDYELMSVYNDIYKKDIDMYLYFLQLRKINDKLIDKKDIINYITKPSKKKFKKK